MAFGAWMAFLLVNIITVVIRGKVEEELSPECREFLYMGTPPTGLDHPSLHFICQRYKQRPRYVTLYNIVDHIPVYSAYTFKRSDGENCVDVPWMYEPQVENLDGWKQKSFNMKTVLFLVQISFKYSRWVF